MIRCVKCNDVYAIAKAGKLRGKQRFFCKDCNLYFVLSNGDDHEQNERKTEKTEVTIKDIAEALGISFSTVSKALLDKSEISSATKKKVFEMAEKLNYEPNLNAKTLVRQKSNTVGLVIPSITSSFFYPEIIQGIQEVLNDKNYNLLICISQESLESEIANCKQLLSNRVDGVIVSITSRTTNIVHLQEFVDKNIPIVFVNRSPDNFEASRVTGKNYEGAYKAVEHLILQGCKRIAHIAGPPNLSFTQERLRGYYNALNKYGVLIDESLIVYNYLFKDNAKECIEQLLSLPELPDAVFTYTDFLAIDFVLAAKERNIRIPEDICVVGFSNDPVSKIIEPPITTLSNPTTEFGKMAAEILIEKIEHKELRNVNTSRFIDLDLIVRESSLRKKE